MYLYTFHGKYNLEPLDFGVNLSTNVWDHVVVKIIYNTVNSKDDIDLQCILLPNFQVVWNNFIGV